MTLTKVQDNTLSEGIIRPKVISSLFFDLYFLPTWAINKNTYKCLQLFVVYKGHLFSVQFIKLMDFN